LTTLVRGHAERNVEISRSRASVVVNVLGEVVYATIRIAGGLAGLFLGALVAGIVGNRRVTVRGVSMRPALNEGEQVLVDRWAYRLGGRPRRGEIVLVRGPMPSGGLAASGGADLLLKRLVGLPGETVMVVRDRLWIDGRPLDLGRPVVGSSPGQWVLGPDAYFVLSENLAIGTDSRHTGPIRRADLLGRAWLVYAPSVRRLAGGRRP
jgi:signal peptidase I